MMMQVTETLNEGLKRGYAITVTAAELEEKVNEKLDEWAAQIKEATEEASQKHADAIKVAQWESAMNTLKDQLRFARNK